MRHSLKCQDKIDTAFSVKSMQRVEDIQDNREANALEQMKTPTVALKTGVVFIIKTQGKPA